MRNKVGLAVLTAAFVAGSMAIAHAQSAGGGGGSSGGGAGGDTSNAGAPPSSGANSAQRNGGNPYLKDERFHPLSGNPR